MSAWEWLAADPNHVGVACIVLAFVIALPCLAALGISERRGGRR